MAGVTPPGAQVTLIALIETVDVAVLETLDDDENKPTAGDAGERQVSCAWMRVERPTREASLQLAIVDAVSIK